LLCKIGNLHEGRKFHEFKSLSPVPRPAFGRGDRTDGATNLGLAVSAVERHEAVPLLVERDLGIICESLVGAAGWWA
jgi:hypothetical protein